MEAIERIIKEVLGGYSCFEKFDDITQITTSIPNIKTDDVHDILDPTTAKLRKYRN